MSFSGGHGAQGDPATVLSSAAVAAAGSGAHETLAREKASRAHISPNRAGACHPQPYGTHRARLCRRSGRPSHHGPTAKTFFKPKGAVMALWMPVVFVLLVIGLSVPRGSGR